MILKGQKLLRFHEWDLIVNIIVGSNKISNSGFIYLSDGLCKEFSWSLTDATQLFDDIAAISLAASEKDLYDGLTGVAGIMAVLFSTMVLYEDRGIASGVLFGSIGMFLFGMEPCISVDLDSSEINK